MVNEEHISAKRYGVRYGRRLREKVGKLDKIKRDSNICPYCHYKRVARLAMGIWFCNKCSSKFTDRAYFIGKKVEEAELLIGKKVEEAELETESIVEETGAKA